MFIQRIVQDHFRDPLMHVHNLDQNLLMYWIYFLLFIMRLKKTTLRFWGSTYLCTAWFNTPPSASNLAKSRAQINKATDFLNDSKDFTSIPGLWIDPGKMHPGTKTNNLYSGSRWRNTFWTTLKKIFWLSAVFRSWRIMELLNVQMVRPLPDSVLLHKCWSWNCKHRLFPKEETSVLECGVILYKCFFHCNKCVFIWTSLQTVTKKRVSGFSFSWPECSSSSCGRFSFWRKKVPLKASTLTFFFNI